jgi:hypothetical protein
LTHVKGDSIAWPNVGKAEFNRSRSAMKTDAQIKKDVLNALKWSSEIREEHIGVAVHNAASL